MNCICCGARLLTGGICDETSLCSKNECFLRWLTSEAAAKDVGSLSTAICKDWKCHHAPLSPESD